MTVVVEVTAASEVLLPGRCSGCTWWQSTSPGGQEGGSEENRAWVQEVVGSWGSVGLVMLEGQDTLASVRFAPLEKLSRTRVLLPSPPDERGALLYCLRGRVGRPSYETRRLVQKSLALLKSRRVRLVYAYARPLGSEDACGFKNLCGKEFLERLGFEHTAEHQGVSLMRVRLEGTVDALVEAGGRLARLRGETASPSPATFTGKTQ